MCRLLGVVASEKTDFRVILREAPRSLATLSREHPHGWGVAVYESAEGWFVQKSPRCAADDEAFHEVSAGRSGELLLAHIRKRTVGPLSLENTHPFVRGRWLFAHNGTITETSFLRERTHTARLAEIEGDTDSELFFAFLLSRFDGAQVHDQPASVRTDDILYEVLREVRARPAFGACNFLLTDGQTLYAHRFGRSLHLLERRPTDQVRTERESIETGARIETPWSPRRHAVLVASERITDEPWRELEEGTLVRIDRSPVPTVRVLA